MEEGGALNTTLIVILAVVNVPVYLFLGKRFFTDWQGLWEAVKFWLTPDIISMFRGEYFEDWWESAKLFVFVALCLAVVAAEYTVLDSYF